MQTKPTILASGGFSEDDLNALRNNHPIWKVVDIYDQQLQELAEITFPDGDQAKRRALLDHMGSGDMAGAWVYYPWSGILLHCVGEAELYVLRTNRNKNLITFDEQKKLSAFTVAVAGMSVGSGMALACVYSGISNTLKIADFDTLETANLNRLRESLSSVGISKAELAAHRVYEINPFADVQDIGRLTVDSLGDFLQNPKPGVVFDEIDDFEMKIRLRIAARDARIPVIMLTSLGDNILVDVERFDIEEGLQLFHGVLGDLPEEILNSDIGEKEKIKYATQLVGAEHVPTRALGSLLEIGKSLVGRPQLFGTIAIDGGLASFLVRRLALGQSLPSGRNYLSLEKALNFEPSGDEDRMHIIEQLKQRIS